MLTLLLLIVVARTLGRVFGDLNGVLTADEDGFNDDFVPPVLNKDDAAEEIFGVKEDIKLFLATVGVPSFADKSFLLVPVVFADDLRT